MLHPKIQFLSIRIMKRQAGSHPPCTGKRRNSLTQTPPDQSSQVVFFLETNVERGEGIWSESCHESFILSLHSFKRTSNIYQQ